MAASDIAVRAREPTAERITYLPVSPDLGGIPAPVTTGAIVEFDRDGITCTADVSGLEDHRPVVDDPACDNVGLTTRSSNSFDSSLDSGGEDRGSGTLARDCPSRMWRQ